MAELAYLLHWPLDQLDAMAPDELMQWRERAVAIHNHIHGGQQQ